MKPRTRTAPQRDRKFHLQLSDQEHEQLAEVARAAGVSMTDWLRQEIRRAHLVLERSARRAEDLQ